MNLENKSNAECDARFAELLARFAVVTAMRATNENKRLVEDAGYAVTDAYDAARVATAEFR